MTAESIQKKCLEKILNSKDFTGSKIYQDYLRYLVESTEAGKDLKETTIAIELFGKDASFNPAEDTTVRSHSYVLRKKLENYYLTEGKEDKYRLRIPKGHYTTKFVPVAAYTSPLQSLTSRLKKLYLFFIYILMILVVGLFVMNRHLVNEVDQYHIVSPTDPIWFPYLQSDLPILIILGDHFLFNDYSEKYDQVISIRHPKVNSSEDLNKLTPQPSSVTLPEPYFPYHSVWSLPPVLSVLYSVHKTPFMKRSAEITPQILDEYNIIYLGSIKTLYSLRHTLNNTHFTFTISPHSFIYTPPDGSKPEVFTTDLHSHGPNDDLVLVLKMPGPVNNSIFMVASFHSLGSPEVVKYLVQPESLKTLEDKMMAKYGEIPDYFEILFRVTGIDKTAYQADILVMNELKQ